MKAAAMQQRNQRGVVLVICLIFLVLMTMFAVTVFGLGKTNLQIVGNMQQRNQVLNAANQVAEEALSTKRLFLDPQHVLLNPCNGNANTRCYDVNGGGQNDIVVALTTPACVVAQTIKNSTLDLSQSDDEGCALGVVQGGFGTAGAATGDSLCAQTIWDVSAAATDATTQATASVTQGASVRVSTDAVAQSCP